MRSEVEALQHQAPIRRPQAKTSVAARSALWPASIFAAAMIAKFKMRKVHQEEKPFRLTAKHSDGGGPSSQLELFMAELREPSTMQSATSTASDLISCSSYCLTHICTGGLGCNWA